MGFRECYLVPKELYEKQKQDKPVDVKLKEWDYNKRFQNSIHIPNEDEKLDLQIAKILSGIPDVLRRNLASRILRFVVGKGGGTISWTDDFEVFLDNKRLDGLDIREVLRQLVGVNVDSNRESYSIYERLLDLGIEPALLKFYNPSEEQETFSDQEDEEEKYETLSEDEEKPESWTDDEEKPESWSDDEEKLETKHLGKRKHPMILRKKRLRWESYNF